MEANDYCSYELSLALKKHGFDEPCDHYWYKVYANSDEMNMRQASADDYNNDDWDVPHCSAPTLWQAQKWLREVHSIHIQIAPVRDGKPEKISWHMVGGYRILELMGTSDFVVAVPYSEIDHCSYESALSAGIAAALELIEKKGE